MKSKVVLLLTLFYCIVVASNAYATDGVVTVLYDSRYEQLSGVPKNFNVRLFDLSKPSRIEKEINRRLVYKGPRLSEFEMEVWGRNKVASDSTLKSLVDELPLSYAYLNEVVDYDIKKIPAVIYSESDNNFVIYGQPNITKALNQINAYRVGNRR